MSVAAAHEPYHLVTCGQSFHWTDEIGAAEAVHDRVVLGGALLLVGHKFEGLSVPPRPEPPPIPYGEIRELVRRYLGPTQRAGRSTPPVQALSLEDAVTGSRSDSRG